jgi:hypothetical protein
MGTALRGHIPVPEMKGLIQQMREIQVTGGISRMILPEAGL